MNKLIILNELSLLVIEKIALTFAIVGELAGLEFWRRITHKPSLEMKLIVDHKLLTYIKLFVTLGSLYKYVNLNYLNKLYLECLKSDTLTACKFFDSFSLLLVSLLRKS